MGLNPRDSTISHHILIPPCGDGQALRALEEISKEVDSRSVYARPFPMDVNIDKLLSFFGEQAKVTFIGAGREDDLGGITECGHIDIGGITEGIEDCCMFCFLLCATSSACSRASHCPNHHQVNCIRMRRHMGSKTFKGSIFVEFDSVESMEKVRNC